MKKVEVEIVDYCLAYVILIINYPLLKPDNGFDYSQYRLLCRRSLVYGFNARIYLGLMSFCIDLLYQSNNNVTPNFSLIVFYDCAY